MSDERDLVDRLQKMAVRTSEASKMLAEMRERDYAARGDVGAKYSWLKPEQTTEWEAAAEITALCEQIVKLTEAKLDECEIEAAINVAGDTPRDTVIDILEAGFRARAALPPTQAEKK